MSVQIEMPQMSADGDSATLATWLVEVGDEVAQGDVIAELETDKSTLELEAPASGTIGELIVAAGTEDVAPGTLLGRIESAGADAGAESEEKDGAGSSAAESSGSADASSDDTTGDTSEESSGATENDEKSAGTSAGGGDSSSAAPARTSQAPDASPAGVASAGAQGAPKSTPLARRAAIANEIDLQGVEGSGPGGRVVEADVLRASQGGGSGGPAAAESTASGETKSREGAEPSSVPEGVEVVRLSAMRKTIARRLSESKREVPHFYLAVRVAMDELLAVRAKLNAGLAEEGANVKISVNDFVIRAAALALRDVPAANVQFAGDAMHVFDRVDISVAVATEGGLVTPVVADADRKGLTRLAEEVKDLARQAREGSLRPEQYQGGTLTISNLGMYGIETVYPILNPPQACILGVGAAEEQPVVRGGEIVIGHRAVFTLAADHRAVDGAVGAELLAALRSRLEDPMGMML